MTKFLHCFFPSFDPPAVIAKMRAGKNWSASPYFGKTDAEIMGEWNASGREASRAGTKMHAGIEAFFNDQPVPADIQATTEWKYFCAFWAAHSGDLEPYRMEWQVWVEELKLAGSIDCVFRRRSDGAFLIYDWKRCKDIKSENFFETGFAPLDHLPNTNYWQYSLQLNIYRWILEHYYDLHITDMYLLVLHPNYATYKRMRLNRMDTEVEACIEARREALRLGRDGVVLPQPATVPEEHPPDATFSGECMIRF